MRRMIGAILRVTVPATIIRSDWRGDARKTPAPKRSMSYRDDTVPIISIAQHASPNVIGQSDPLRHQLMAASRVVVTMLASSDRSISPINSYSVGRSLSVPFQRPLLPSVEVAHEQDRDEDQHLDQGEEAELLEDDGPGEDEHRLDVEDHEQHRNDIVPHRDLAARVVKDRRAALVGHELGLVGTRGPDEIARQEGTDTEGGGDHQEEEDWQVVLDDQIGH